MRLNYPKNNLPGISIFKFRMYFTNLQTIINYSQEELHLHYNFLVVSDNSINVDVELNRGHGIFIFAIFEFIQM